MTATPQPLAAPKSEIGGAVEAPPRRTFAIISHPDAGKTTLTEKLLLASGVLHLAGSIRSRKAARHAVSDWMEMERQRGISITSSVLQFPYGGAAINLLDTPGHADFSEDTYRTLAAVDGALMLIDHAKGVEARTLKLFQVCRMRRLPVVTFMNKLDRAGRDPLELMDDVATQLDLGVSALTWPLGSGPDFRGVVDVRTGEAILPAGRSGPGGRLHCERVPLEQARGRVGDRLVDEALEAIELLAGAGDPWDREAFLAGELSPVFWGSAMNDLGVEPLLAFLASELPGPAPRTGRDERGQPVEVRPVDRRFTGFVFKIQANMNPRHRDRVAFVRVVSGRFRRGMDAVVGRTGDALRLAHPHSFMAQDRALVDEALPGDIVGLHDPGHLRIGDTLAEGGRLAFDGIPRFAPEHFARIVLRDPSRRKHLDRGLRQLGHEGVIQVFIRPDVGIQDPWLGAVGRLQFEVLLHRLQHEYGVRASLGPLPFTVARWVRGDLEWLRRHKAGNLVEDRLGRPVLLAASPWELDYVLGQVEGLQLLDVEPLDG